MRGKPSSTVVYPSYVGKLLKGDMKAEAALESLEDSSYGS
jgi:hypothetical protein